MPARSSLQARSHGRRLGRTASGGRQPRTAGCQTAAGCRILADQSAQYASDNPLIAAAAPLLLLLGKLRQSTVEMDQPRLVSAVSDAVRAFDRQIAQADVLPADARMAKYALCETADDIVLNLPGVDKSAWTSNGMLAILSNRPGWRRLL
jgi:type VI secretion system protein ImpK